MGSRGPLRLLSWKLGAMLSVIFVAAYSSGTSAAEDLERLVSASSDLEAVVHYEAMIGDASGEIGDATGEIVVASRPPDRRIDINRDNGPDESFIMHEGVLYQCLDAVCSPSTGESESTVLDSLYFVDFVLDFQTQVEEEGANELDVREVEERTIADLAAECFETNWNELRVTTCLSGEGVLLANEVSDPQGSFFVDLEATSVRFDVSAEDISPPGSIATPGDQ